MFFNEYMDTKEIQKNVRATLAKAPLVQKKVRSISLFGSYLHGQATKDSDVDLLVELAEPVGFFELARIQTLMENGLERKVDIVTTQSLSPYFRDAVVREAKLVYGS